MAVKSKLNEINDQLNHQLVQTLFEQNSWDTTVLPFFDYELPNQETLDNKGKFWQRAKAVGLIPIVPQVINQVLRDIGVDYQVPDNATTEELMKLLDPAGTGVQSESGKGMQQGMSNTNGTSTAGSGDASVSNNSNA